MRPSKLVHSLLITALLLTFSTTASAAEQAVTTDDPSELFGGAPPLSTSHVVVSELAAPAWIEQACSIQYCGNTGTLTGCGTTCAAAKAALDAAIASAVNQICLGSVANIAVTYGSCVISGREYCQNGSAEVTCKFCNYEACALN